MVKSVMASMWFMNGLTLASLILGAASAIADGFYKLDPD